MKKLSFNKLTISKLDNLSFIKGGNDTDPIYATSTDQSPGEEPPTDIYILNETNTTLP